MYFLFISENECFHEMKYDRMKSFMEFMSRLKYHDEACLFIWMLRLLL